MSGVTVTLTPAGGTSLSATSGSTGGFEFGTLDPGSYSVAVSVPSGYSVAPGAAPGTVTVGPGDVTVGIGVTPTLPVVTVEKIFDATEDVTGANGVFRFTRTGDASQPLTVFYTVSGTATPAADYTALPGHVAFAAGASTVDVPVAAIDDSIAEPDETVNVTLADIVFLDTMSGGVPYTVGTPSSATVTIADDEPIVSVYALTDAVEGDAASEVKGQFRFVRTGNLSQPLSAYFDIGGTATDGTDYATLSTGVLFPANQDTVDLIVDPENDGIAEGTEDVWVLLQTSSLYTRGYNSLADINIFDAPPAGGGSGGNPAPAGTGTGLFARYYNTKELYDLKTTRIDEQIKFYDWHTGGPPGANVGADDFSVQWVGKVQAQYNERYTFYTYSDDGVRLWVNGDLIIDEWNDHSGREDCATMSVPFEAGKMYDIKMEYYEHRYAAHAELRWRSTSTPKDFIPKSQLYPIAFDLDVNADGDILDTVDGANDYLPGYEGTTQKVSTGTSFNTDIYTGQRMKLVLDGVGANDLTVVKVEFTITSVSRHPGYASNRSVLTVEEEWYDKDYSFLADEDRDSFIITREGVENNYGRGPYGGQMDASRTWINFYAKDYGGAAAVTAKVWIFDGTVVKVGSQFELKVPKDDDGDGIADKWEIQMGKRWTTQYGVAPFTVDQALARFNPTIIVFGQIQDDEREDSDGTTYSALTPIEFRPLVAQKEQGDSHTVVEEYRGYILDGGGFDGSGQNGHAGGHIRLDPARKEILVEVDRAATLVGLPGNGTDDQKLKTILDSSSKVFSNAQRGAGIYMYYLFDGPALNLPNDKIDKVTKSVDELANSRNVQLMSDFMHLLVVDESLINMVGGNQGIAGWSTTRQMGVTLGLMGEAAAKIQGSVIGTTNLNNSVPTATYPNRVEVFATVIAHELTHQLVIKFDTDATEGFNAKEHTSADQADILYDPLNPANTALATVKFTTTVQAALLTKNGEWRTG